MSIEIEKSVFIDSLKGRMSPPIYDEAQALLAEGCARRHTHSPARARAAAPPPCSGSLWPRCSQTGVARRSPLMTAAQCNQFVLKAGIPVNKVELENFASHFGSDDGLIDMGQVGRDDKDGRAINCRRLPRRIIWATRLRVAVAVSSVNCHL